MTKVSVIMPVYNAGNFLEDSCESVSNQTLKDIELICVDDGSTDNSLELLNKLSKKYNFIRIFSQENQGSGKARNFGISNSVGDYIAFLDADDKFLDKNALEKMYECAVKHNAFMVGANLMRIKRNGEIEESYDFKNTKFKYFFKDEIISPIDYGIPFAFYKNMYNRQFIVDNEIEFPDLIRGQDPIFLADVLTKIDELPVLNIDLYGYNHSIGGGVNIKINTYDKKFDYISHFKKTFDILRDNNFSIPFESYKREFVDYILFMNNIYDEDIKKAFSEIFPDIEVYFSDEDYGFPFLKYLNEPIDEENDLTEFETIKKCLVRETLINDNFIDGDYLKDYISVVEKYKNDGIYIEKSSLKIIKDIQQEVNDDYNYLVNELDGISDEVESVSNIANTNSISKSFKFSIFLDKLKNFYRS